MTTLRGVLQHKGNEVLVIGPSDSVYEAIERMARHDVGCLVVVEDGQVMGILTERDYLRDVALKGRSSRSTEVREIMSHPVVQASSDDTIAHCMAVMTEKRCRHLPVAGPDGLVGLVSIGDLVRQIVRDQEAEIRDLQGFIRGSYSG